MSRPLMSHAAAASRIVALSSLSIAIAEGFDDPSYSDLDRRVLQRELRSITREIAQLLDALGRA